MNNLKLVLSIAVLSSFLLISSQSTADESAEKEKPKTDMKIEIPNEGMVFIRVNQNDGTMDECTVGVTTNPEEVIITLWSKDHVMIAQYNTKGYSALASTPEIVQPHLLVFVDKKASEEHKEGDGEIPGSYLYIINHNMLTALKEDFGFKVEEMEGIEIRPKDPSKHPIHQEEGSESSINA